jgi:hypothetical protein
MKKRQLFLKWCLTNMLTVVIIFLAAAFGAAQTPNLSLVGKLMVLAILIIYSITTIYEPDGNGSDSGAIYMWMRLEGGNDKKWWFTNPSVGTLPQVFKFSYSREFHEAIVSALGKILEDNGNPIEIAFDENNDQQGKIGRAGGAGSRRRKSIPRKSDREHELSAGRFLCAAASKTPAETLHPIMPKDEARRA